MTVQTRHMDEERRTSVNLPSGIAQAKSGVALFNSPVPRTATWATKIHTSMEAGPLVPKADEERARGSRPIEDRQRRYRLACACRGARQIGKGIGPCLIYEAMLDAKSRHPKFEQNCAWLPIAVTAATLHAMHIIPQCSGASRTRSTGGAVVRWKTWPGRSPVLRGQPVTAVSHRR